MIYLNGTLFIHNSVVNNYLSKLDKSTLLILNKIGIDMINKVP